jgi:peptidoglycan/xylan/chitin deacetylase (PgdA/CDA1 family)
MANRPPPAPPERSYPDLLGDSTFLILLCHGVIRSEHGGVRNSVGKHLTAEAFEHVLNDLLVEGAPASIEDVSTAIKLGKALPPKSFVLTFDDGFANNYITAAPILRRLGVPATFYVSTSFIDQDLHSWTDMIESALEATSEVHLELPFMPAPKALSTTNEKLALMGEVRRHVKNDSTIDPYAFAMDVLHQCGLETMQLDPELDVMMSWEQVAELDRDPLFTIGGHGHTHRILDFLSTPDLEQEIAISYEKLQEHLDRPIDHYSYPEGMANCYSDRVIGILRQHGAITGVTAEPDLNRIGDDRFRLKRITVV